MVLQLIPAHWGEDAEYMAREAQAPNGALRGCFGAVLPDVGQGLEFRV